MSKHCLVVDDSRVIRTVARRIMEALRYSVDEAEDGMGEGGMVSFSTDDPPSKVVAFYEAKLKEMGMTLNLSGSTSDGGMVTGTDEAGRRTIHVMVGSGQGSGSTIAVTFGRKR